MYKFKCSEMRVEGANKVFLPFPRSHFIYAWWSHPRTENCCYKELVLLLPDLQFKLMRWRTRSSLAAVAFPCLTTKPLSFIIRWVVFDIRTVSRIDRGFSRSNCSEFIISNVRWAPERKLKISSGGSDRLKLTPFERNFGRIERGAGDNSHIIAITWESWQVFL